MNIYKKNNDIRCRNLTKEKRVCRCGHVVTMDRVRKLKNKKGYFICGWCGGRIYYDPIRQLEHNAKCDREQFRLYLIREIRIMEGNYGNNKKRNKRG